MQQHGRAILTEKERRELEMLIATETTYREVAHVTGLDERIIRLLVRDGLIAGGEGLCDLDDATIVAEQLAEARQPVDGQGITATEAGERYGFHRNVIYNWSRAGWVAEIGTAEQGGATLYNEGDIAVARALADLREVTGNQSVFPPRPRPGRPPRLRQPA